MQKEAVLFKGANTHAARTYTPLFRHHSETILTLSILSSPHPSGSSSDMPNTSRGWNNSTIRFTLLISSSR